MQRRLRTLAKAVRARPGINRIVAAPLRALGSPDWAVTHWPVHGHLEIPTPWGPIQLETQSDDWIPSRLWWRGWEAFEGDTVPLWCHYAADAQVILDVGAYIGWYSLLAWRIRPDAQIVAFEPHDVCRRRLAANIAANGATVEITPLAVSDHSGNAVFHSGAPGLPSSSGLADYFPFSGEATQVECIRLDEHCASMSTVDLIKIDIEQGEPAALRGARDILARHRPVVIYEIMGEGESAEAIGEAVSELKGYRHWLLTPNGPVEQPGPSAGLRTTNHAMVPVEKEQPDSVWSRRLRQSR